MDYFFMFLFEDIYPYAMRENKETKNKKILSNK